eukprot:scaffold116928_cov30-Prasinocladus_malaysianus.AAC.1
MQAQVRRSKARKTKDSSLHPGLLNVTAAKAQNDRLTGLSDGQNRVCSSRDELHYRFTSTHSQLAAIIGLLIATTSGARYKQSTTSNLVQLDYHSLLFGSSCPGQSHQENNSFSHSIQEHFWLRRKCEKIQPIHIRSLFKTQPL